MSYHGSGIAGATMSRRNSQMSQPVTQALDRLFDLAASDTGQARRAANFLLAWWNAQDGSVANMGHGRAASPSWGIRQHWRNAY